MSIILKAENISKQYRLGLVGTGTMSDDLKRWWFNVRGKEDPFLKVGGVNDRGAKATEDYVWALRDINFEVKTGEVLGIIGKNGAGKSTLLKLLSRVTSPTTGNIKTRGRIASLLEIGTGFHPELTGRENIFMNGAVLGMTTPEIKRKLEEIIDFSGCEMYIDTPVKRYSSGMTVRLGFAVAAHLEPEILVVDEVLAVGDAEFQRKAIGKMQHLSSSEGRTVLFVSHNMGSIKALSDRTILLKNGKVQKIGLTDQIVEDYASLEVSEIKKFDFERHMLKNTALKFQDVNFLNKNRKKTSVLISGDKIIIEFKIFNSTKNEYKNCSIGIGIFTLNDNLLIALKNDMIGKVYNIFPGENLFYCEVPKFPLPQGFYKYNLILSTAVETVDWIKDVGILEVENGLFFPTGKIPARKTPSVLIEHCWL